jgi:hypothetical protein
MDLEVISLKEFAERCWSVPEKYLPNHYMMIIHTAGMVDEYPTVVFTADWDGWGYDGLFEESMVVCVESFIGEGRCEGGTRAFRRPLGDVVNAWLAVRGRPVAPPNSAAFSPTQES